MCIHSWGWYSVCLGTSGEQAGPVRIHVEGRAQSYGPLWAKRRSFSCWEEALGSGQKKARAEGNEET